MIKALAALFCLMFATMGAASVFAPTLMGPQFAVDTHTQVGLSTLRGVLGGLFLGSATLMFLGLVQGQATWFRAAGIAVGMVAVGRTVGFVLDGPNVMTVLPFVVECSTVSVLWAASRRADLGDTRR